MAELALFGCSIIWSLAYLFTQNAARAFDINVVIFYRHCIGALVLLPFARRTALFHKPTIIVGAIGGTLLWALIYFMGTGLLEGRVSNAGFIVSLFVLIVPVVNRIVYKKVLLARDYGSILLSLFGVWLVAGGVANLSYSDLLFFIAAILCAVHVILVERYAERLSDALCFSIVQCIFAALCGLLAALVDRSSFSIPTLSSAIDIAYLGIFSSAIGLWLQMYGQRTVAAWRACLIFATEPFLTALFAWSLAGEVFTRNAFVGGGCIIAAILVSKSNLLDGFSLKSKG